MGEGGRWAGRPGPVTGSALPARVLSGRSGSRSGEERGEYAAQARFHLDDGVAEPGVGGVELAEAGARGGHLPQGPAMPVAVDTRSRVCCSSRPRRRSNSAPMRATSPSAGPRPPLVFAAGMVALCFWVLWMRRCSWSASTGCARPCSRSEQPEGRGRWASREPAASPAWATGAHARGPVTRGTATAVPWANPQRTWRFLAAPALFRDPTGLTS